MQLPAWIDRVNKATFVTLSIACGIAVGMLAHRFVLRDEATAIDGSSLQATVDDAAQAASRPPLALTLDAGATTTGTQPGPRVDSYHDGILRVAPSVVSLYASIEGERTERVSSQGSGVIVDADGIVLTNLHLIEGADVINVVLSDGTLHTGTLMGSDRETDLAVVSIDASGLPAVTLDDAEPLRVGDIVLAIGNPFGVGQTVTQGIVSATRRRVAGGSAWQDFVQIDAAINPGSSGGALINPAGQLVGVTSAVFRGNNPGASSDNQGLALGIGFAIPADLLARVVPEIIANGRVVRGWLGVGADDLPMFPELHRLRERGAVVTEVLPESPASLAGLQPFDIVIALDGQEIVDATELLLRVSSLGHETIVSLDVQRGDVVRTIKVRLGERPPPETDPPR